MIRTQDRFFSHIVDYTTRVLICRVIFVLGKEVSWLSEIKKMVFNEVESKCKEMVRTRWKFYIFSALKFNSIRNKNHNPFSWCTRKYFIFFRNFVREDNWPLIRLKYGREMANVGRFHCIYFLPQNYEKTLLLILLV